MTAELEPVAWDETAPSREYVNTLKSEIEALRVTLSSAQEAIDKREERIRELEAALDHDPDGSGLWRYWSSKSSEIAQKLVEEIDRADAAEARVKELECERDAFRGVLEGAEYGDIEGIAKYDADKARALGRMVGNLSKGLRIQVAATEARASALQALLDEVGEVIEPFAGYVVPDPDPNSVSGERFGTKPDLKAFRAARSLAAKIKEAKG